MNMQDVTLALGRTRLVLEKNAPQIMVGLGIVGGITAAVMASKATLKLKATQASFEPELAMVHEARDNAETASGQAYSEEDFQRDLTIVHTQRIAAVIRLYLPAVALGLVSIGSIVYGHHILNKRNAALMAAYKLIQDSYDKYRQAVIDDVGHEKDREYRFGEKAEEIKTTTVDEDGKKHRDVMKVINREKAHLSDYSAEWGEMTTRKWQRDANMNAFFLTNQQAHANDKLNATGHLFLNEVFDMLGLPRTSEGQIVGWVKSNKDDDNEVDFGLFDENGHENMPLVPYIPVLLVFNVDGVIYDLIS